MKLSPHISLEELTRTDIRWMGEENSFNAVQFIPVLKRVAEELIEPVRTLFHDAPIYVHSGFRCAKLNTLVGGSPTSQHLVGEAVDFDIAGHQDAVSRRNALDWIAASEIRFHQLLIENACLHISLPKEEGPNGEVAFWDSGRKTIIRAGA